jgi:hypothetical protein
MAFLTRDQVKEIVIDSLSTVADLPSNVEAANFNGMSDFQKHLFLTTIKSKLNALPFHMNNGSTNHLAFYDVDLMPDSVDDWPTVKDCIDFINSKQKVVFN